jgi:hypothetical protein
MPVNTSSPQQDQRDGEEVLRTLCWMLSVNVGLTLVVYVVMRWP